MIIEHRFTHIPQDGRRGRAWVASHIPMAEVRLASTATVPIDAYHRHHLLGDAVLAAYQAPAQTVDRPKALVARQALDHLVLRAQIRGRLHIDADGQTGEALPGDILLFTLARAIRIAADPAYGIELIVPRRVLSEGTPPLATVHGRILHAGGHPLVRMVSDHLGNLSACLAHEAPPRHVDLVPPTLALCRTLLTTLVQPVDDVPPDPLGTALRRYIEENLAIVDVPMLMGHFGLSQRALYRHFPDVGVSSFIRDRRLTQAMRELARIPPGARPPKLARLAHDCGFADPRVFSRAFRRRYGVRPAEARGGAVRPDEGTPPDGPLTWLRAL